MRTALGVALGLVLLGCGQGSPNDDVDMMSCAQTLCGDSCVDLENDAAHCGACDTACAVVCVAGACAESCPLGQLACDQRCVDPQSDSDHCGASGDCAGGNAGTACGQGETCSLGTCQAGASTPDSLTALAIVGGTLSPAFAPDETMYVVSVPTLSAAVQVTPTAAAGASITVNGIAVVSGSAAAPVPVGAGGMATITIAVSAPGAAGRTYTLMLMRDSAHSLKAADPTGLGQFGNSIALSGDTLVVGAWLQPNGSGLATGAVYVFVRSGNTWTQQAKLQPANGDANDLFGLAVALDGDTLAVGAAHEASGNAADPADNSSIVAGAVYVFVRSGTSWTQQAYLKASNITAFDEFGDSLALSGNTLAISSIFEDSGDVANQADNSASASGAVYVFVRSGTTWTQQAYLKASNLQADDNFGVSVALSGETLAVGAAGEDSGATAGPSDDSAPNSGAVYVFTRSGTTWTEQVRLKAANAEAGDAFGLSVSLDGDVLAVGAQGEDSGSTGMNGDPLDNGAPDSGAAYVFTRTGGAWTQTGYIKASNGEMGDGFGAAVALRQGRLLVGAPGEDGNGTGVGGDPSNNGLSDAGAAYLFTSSGAAWTQRNYLKATNPGQSDRFGEGNGFVNGSLALSATTVAVGTRTEDGSGTGFDPASNEAAPNNAGAVYLYSQ